MVPSGSIRSAEWFDHCSCRLNPLAVSNGEEGFSLDISIGLNGEGSVSASDQNG